MKYFVTGSTGFIGGVLTRQLVAAGHRVHALVRDPGRATALADLGVELFAGDVRDRDSVRRAMTGVDGLFHVAAWYQIGARDFSDAWSTNVQGTRNVLEVMGELGVAKGVYTSTLAVFSDTRGHVADEHYRYVGRMNSEYERTKHAAHYEVALPLMEQGLPLVIVMPGVVYGPGDHSPIHDAFVMFLQRRLPMVPKTSKYCWSHVEDVATGHVLAMDKGTPGESYILSGDARGFAEVFDLASELTGVRAPLIRVGAKPLRVAACLAGVAERLLPGLPSAYRRESLASVAGTTSLASDAKAREELGWSTRPLRDGLREMLHHEMARLHIEIPPTL